MYFDILTWLIVIDFALLLILSWKAAQAHHTLVDCSLPKYYTIVWSHSVKKQLCSWSGHLDLLSVHIKHYKSLTNFKKSQNCSVGLVILSLMVLPQLVLLSIQFIVCAVHIYIPGIALASVPWQSSFSLSTLGCLETPAGNLRSFFFLLYRKRCTNKSKKGRRSLVSSKQLMTSMYRTGIYGMSM